MNDQVEDVVGRQKKEKWTTKLGPTGSRFYKDYLVQELFLDSSVEYIAYYGRGSKECLVLVDGIQTIGERLRKDFKDAINEIDARGDKLELVETLTQEIIDLQGQWGLYEAWNLKSDAQLQAMGFDRSFVEDLRPHKSRH